MYKYQLFLRYLKPIGLIVCAIFLLLVRVATLSPSLNPLFQLDPNWMMAIPDALINQDKVLGRDFFFTYGPFYQLINSIGVISHAENISIFSYPLIILAQDFIGYLILIALFLSIPFLTGWQAVLAMIIFGANSRISLLFLSIAVFLLALQAENWKWRTSWGICAGVLIFLAQTYSFDIGIYALTAILLLFTSLAIVGLIREKVIKFPGQPQKFFRKNIFTVFTAISVFGLLNIMLSIFYLNSGTNYAFLFKYQLVSFEIVTGYVYKMGLPMGGGYLNLMLSVLSAILLMGSIVLFTLIKSFAAHAQLLLGFLICAGLLTKSALLRADFEHLIIFLWGSFFYIYLAVCWLQGKPAGSKLRTLTSTLILIFLFIGYTQLSDNFLFAPENFKGNIDLNIGSKISRLKTYHPEPYELEPHLYQLPNDYQAEPEFILVGTENYIANLQGTDLSAPTVQDYAIITPFLEQLVVDEILVNKYPPILFNYSSSLDGLPGSVRYPILFEFMLKNYHLTSIRNLDREHHMLVLEKRAEPQGWVEKTIAFAESKEIEGTYILEEPIQCPLVKLSLSMQYPPVSLLYRSPGKLAVRLSGESSNTFTEWYAISPSENASPFEVYLITLPKEDQWSLFFDQPTSSQNEVPRMDQFEVRMQVQGKNFFSIEPEYRLDQFKCIQGENSLWAVR